MSLGPQFLDELRMRTTLSSVIQRHTKLQKAGREWKACCPFHKEKTPSFTVNDEKGFFHCFGCGAHGDAISFVTETRGLSFIDAVKELAEQAGMRMPAPDPRARERQEQSASLRDVTEAAADWYVEELAGPAGAEARAYLDQRGIGEETRRRFGLGFAPDDRGKLEAALKQYDRKMLLEAGLIAQPEDANRSPYDRFRDRLMFPIRDRRGRVIAFSGRLVGAGEKEAGKPKYLN
ncbi:MAG: DNA primase, partial [Parasphingopyxis sp.]